MLLLFPSRGVGLVAARWTPDTPEQVTSFGWTDAHSFC